MRQQPFSLLVLIIILISLNSQAQMGRIGINTTSPQAILHVKDSSVLFSGFGINFPPGNPPASGVGVRMMWYPDKSALRAGYVDGVQWDKTNIGEYSLAAGFNPIAAGRYTSALGLSTIANGAASLVIGQFNDPIVTSQLNVIPGTPLFIVGNGDDALNPSNAMVVRKDGNVGIGNINPTHRLHIVNRGKSGAVPNANASVVLDDNNNQYLHFLNPAGFESGILQGRPGNSIRAGIVFTNVSNIQFRTGGNSTKLVIDSLGNVGAGNLVPLVKLEVNGGLALNEQVFTLTNPSTTITVENRSYIQLNSNLDPDARELHLTNGLVTGQMLLLQCIATGGFGFMVRDTDTNIDINGILLLLNLNDTITFIWDGDEWVELHRSAN